MIVVGGGGVVGWNNLCRVHPQPKPQNYSSTKLGEVARSAGGVCQSVDGWPTKSKNGQKEQKEQKEYLVNIFRTQSVRPIRRLTLDVRQK